MVPPKNFKVLQVIAWLSWTVFLLFSIGACVFAVAERHDVYFIRHYQHFPMDKLTGIMTTYPGWMIIVPFLWLPWVRKDNPTVGIFLLQAVTMFMVAVALAILLLCSGPPFQM